MGERKKIRNTDVLLFDEVSMCDGHLFDVLECMVTILRHYDTEIEERGQEHIMDDSQKNHLDPSRIQIPIFFVPLTSFNPLVSPKPLKGPSNP